MMLTRETLLTLDKKDIDDFSLILPPDDLPYLIGFLTEKDNKVRYAAFQLLERRSERKDDVANFLPLFAAMLHSENSYHRSIGVMLMAANAGWDTEGFIEGALEGCFQLLQDEKPITIRQTVKSLQRIAENKPALQGRIVFALLSMDLTKISDTLRKPILTDILDALAAISKSAPSDDIRVYFLGAIYSGLLDKKEIKTYRALLEQMNG